MRYRTPSAHTRSPARLRHSRGNPLGRVACGLEPLEERALLAVTSSFADGVLSLVGDAANDRVQLRVSTSNGQNVVEFNVGAGTVSQAGVTAIRFEGGAGNNTLAFAGNSTTVGLEVHSSDEVQLLDSLRSTGAFAVDAHNVLVRGTLSGPSIDLFAMNVMNVDQGRITSPGGLISVGSSNVGTTNVKGTLDASQPTGMPGVGGSIYVFGKGVTVERSRLDASADYGGGTVLVGGAFQGGSLLPAADYTFVRDQTQITTSARHSGNGGLIVAWSESLTRVTKSMLYAEGGIWGGDGGLVETSGRQQLELSTTFVNARSIQGQAGTWLLDPRNVTIKDMAGDPFFNGGNPNIFNPTADDAIVDRNTIQMALNLGTSVTITTGASGTQDGDITVLDPITRIGGIGTPTLKLQAANNILVDAAIAGAVGFAMDVEIEAGNDIQIAAPINTFGGSFKSTGKGLTTTAAGTISTGPLAGSIDIDQAGPVAISGDLVAATSITIHAGNTGTGDLTFTGAPNLDSPTITLQAGLGDGTLATAKVNVANATFRGAAGAGSSPTAFTLRQDASLTDADIPSVAAPNQFGGGVPANYTLRSDGGTLSLATAAKVAGSTLSLNSKAGASITTALNLASLGVSGPATLNGNITTANNQSYADSLTLGGNVILSGQDLSLQGVTGGGFNLTLSGSGMTTLAGAISGVSAFLSNNGGQTIINAPVSAASVQIAEAVAFDVPMPTVAVQTTGSQMYSGTATLLADTRLVTTTAAGNLTFGSTVTGGGFDLSLGAAGATNFNGSVSGVDALISDGGGATAINAPILATSVQISDALTFAVAAPTIAVQTTGTQNYTGPVTLAANTRVATTTAGGDVTFGSTIAGAGFNLTLSAMGNTQLGGAASGLGAVLVNGGGTTNINAPLTATSLLINDAVTFAVATPAIAVQTTGAQIYSAGVTLGANTRLVSTTAAGNLTFGNTITGAGFNLTLSGAGTTNLNGAISGVGALVIDGGGATNLNAPLTATSVQIADALTLNVATPAIAVQTTGTQTYSAGVTLGANTRLVSTTAAGNIAFNSTIAGGGFNLTVSGAGATTFGGAASNLNTLTSDSGGSTQISAPITATSVQVSEPVTFNVATPAVAVQTTGIQNYTSAATLAANTRLVTTTGAGTLTFGSTIAGAGFNLTLSAAGLTTLNGAVSNVNALTIDGGSSTNVNAPITAASLVMSDAVTLNVAMPTVAVQTTLSQTYGSSVNLAAHTRLLSTTAAGDLTFNGAILGNGFDLMLSGAGTTRLNAPASGLGTFTSNNGGTTVLNSTLFAAVVQMIDAVQVDVPSPFVVVETTTSQVYDGPVTLAANTIYRTTTAGGNITFNSTVNGAGFDLVLSAMGATTINGAVSNVKSLTSDNGGTTIVNAPISAGSLEMFDTATLNVSSPPATVQTTGNQAYHAAVTIAADPTMLSGATITFHSTVNAGANGVQGLLIDGDAVLNGQVGNSARLKNLSITGATQIGGGSIATTTTQGYGGTVTITVDPTTLTGSAISFGSTVNAAADGAQALAINGNANFGGAVGNLARLKSLSVSGTSAINGGQVRTLNTQQYQGAVVVGAALTTLQASEVTFGNTLNAAAAGVQSLSINGNARFQGQVGNSARLNSLSVSGATFVETDLIHTQNFQIYTGPVTVAVDPTVFTGGAINFVSTLNAVVDGVPGVTINGAATFGGTVGGGARLKSLLVNGTSVINGGAVTTTTTQSYSGAVTIGADPTTLTGSEIQFDGPVNAAADGVQALSIVGNATFNNLVGNTARLKSLHVSQSTAINGASVNTPTTQTYDGPVTLGHATPTLTGSAIGFGNTLNAAVDGVPALTINGQATFGGAVGNTARLKSLSVSGASAINGGSVTTTATQNYGGAVTLGADPTTLTGTAVTFQNAVNAAVDGGQALIVAASASFNGPVGNVNKLKSLLVNGTSQLNGSSITTTGAQTYNSAVTLSVNNVLTSTAGGNLTFQSTVNGPGGLTTSTTGLTIFNGHVGGGTPLAFLDATTGGPFDLKTNVTAVNNVRFRVTRTAPAPTGDSITIGDTLTPAAVNKVMSQLGDLELLADNDINLLGNSIVEAAQGNVLIRGDLRNVAPGLTQLNLFGTINAPAAGKNVTIQGNADNDLFNLAGPIQSPTVNVLGIGGLDTINVHRTLTGTTTHLIGGDAKTTAAGGNNLTVNVGSPSGTIDTIQGTLNIKGSPVDRLPAAERILVNYTFSADAGNPPPNATRPSLLAPAQLNANTAPIGNIVNVVDTNRAASGNNVYSLSAAGFTRTGAAPINFVNDASGKFAVQTFTLKAGAQGNNKIYVQVAEDAIGKALSYIRIDGGQTGGTNNNVLRVTSANSSANKAQGTIGGNPVSLNTVIVGDRSVDTPNNDTYQPIEFSQLRSLYLVGSTGADLLVNNSSVFGVFDGNGGGDWMLSGFSQDVMYGGGAPTGKSVFMFGRSSHATEAGYFLPNNSLNLPDTTSLAGTAYIDGNSAKYGVVASNATIKAVTGSIYATAGSVDVISWLRANYQRNSGGILGNARNLINLFPKP